MKKRIVGIIGFCFLMTGIFINLDHNRLKNQENELLLKDVFASAKADGEGKCTRTCFDEKCEATWENVSCNVTCGSTNCEFTFAIKKS